MLAELFHPDMVCHGPPGVNHEHAGGAKPLEHCLFLDAFEGRVFSVREIAVEDDCLVGHCEAIGRRVREFQGVAASNETRVFEGVTTYRVRDGKIAEGWSVLSSR